MLHIDAIPNVSAQVILSLAVMLFAGFLMTRLTKVARLPNVTGYILAGILIGPHLLNLIPETVAVRHGLCHRCGAGLHRLWRRQVL